MRRRFYRPVEFSWNGVLIALGMLAAIGIAGFLSQRSHGKSSNRPRKRSSGRHYGRQRSYSKNPGNVIQLGRRRRRTELGFLARWNLWIPIAAFAGAAGIAYLVINEPLNFGSSAVDPVPAFAAELPVCSGGNRAARHVTCIVDGDTGWEHGRKWRLKNIDAPELAEHAICRAEAARAEEARDRLRELMSGGYRINWTGRNGYYGRALVTITLNDGRDAGRVLLKERLAQPWPNDGDAIWCGR